MESPRVANATDFVVFPASMYGQDGERVVAIVKSTWVLGPERKGRPPELVFAPREQQRGIRFADVHWGDPEATSLRYPADVAIDKPGTDVVVVADACAPGGVAAPHVDVKIAVGPLERMLRAHGPRAWSSRGTAISASTPASRVPLRWELAFGGRAEKEPGVFIEEPRNPVGRGIAVDRAKLEGAPAPQIEAVDRPIQSVEGAPEPVGVGAVGRHWEPRRSHMGTYDPKWLDTRAPLPPRDEDARFACFAAPGLHARTPLSGGEQVTLVNVSPRVASLGFSLPRFRVGIGFELKGQSIQVGEAPIDTVLFDLLPSDDEAPALVVEIIRRAHVVAPRRKRDLTIRVRELPVATAGEASA
jgi:hypothetical protein